MSTNINITDYHWNTGACFHKRGNCEHRWCFCKHPCHSLVLISLIDSDNECAILIWICGNCPSSIVRKKHFEKVELWAVKAELANRGLIWTSSISIFCHAHLSSSSCLTCGGRSNEIAKQDWKRRPECCYFGCWSRSGGKERRALHAAYDICCLLILCSLEPEQVLLVCENHQRWSEVGRWVKDSVATAHPIWGKIFSSCEHFST